MSCRSSDPSGYNSDHLLCLQTMRSELFSQSKKSERLHIEHGILFHTDAVQAFGQVPINVDEMTY